MEQSSVSAFEIAEEVAKKELDSYYYRIVLSVVLSLGVLITAYLYKLKLYGAKYVPD